MNKTFSALITGLFLTQSAIPAHAFLGISLGSDKKEENTVSGSAGPDGAKNESPQLEKCDAPNGTLAVVRTSGRRGAGAAEDGLHSPSA